MISPRRSIVSLEVVIATSSAPSRIASVSLLLPEHSLKQAINAVRIIQQSIEQHDFSDLAPLLNITVSVGVASVENAGDYNRLLNHADQALYRAKQTGRNKVESELS